MVRAGVRILVQAAVGIIVVLLGTTIAAACSCALMTVEEQAEHADVIARVVVSNVDRPADATSSADPATYTVRTAAVWKGDVGAEFTFTSALSGVSCGLEGVEEGHDVLLFAGYGPDGLSTTLCSGTSPATEERVAEISDLLGEGVVPAGAETLPEVPGEERGWILPVAIAGLAALAVVAVYIRRHLRDRAPEN